jgi:hypothetical protein
VYNKAVSQLAETLEKKPDSEIKLPRFSELEAKLKRLAVEAFDNGVQTAKEEINSMNKISMDADPSTPLISVTINDEIYSKINILWSNTQGAISQFLKNQNEDSIKNAGGLKKAIENNFLDQRINDKNNVSATVSGAFLSGRNSVMLSKSADKNVEEYEYTSILDKNLCEQCGGYDGQRATLEDWKTEGMNINPTATSLNPKCYGLKGTNNCRCQLIPVIPK